MTALWTQALDELSQGLSKDALELLHSLWIHKDAFPRPELARYSTGSKGQERARFALRVTAKRMRWGHAGVKVSLESAVLEVNGLPVAQIKLSTAKTHKKGARFLGAKAIFVHFDH